MHAGATTVVQDALAELDTGLLYHCRRLDRLYKGGAVLDDSISTFRD